MEEGFDFRKSCIVLYTLWKFGGDCRHCIYVIFILIDRYDVKAVVVKVCLVFEAFSTAGRNSCSLDFGREGGILLWINSGLKAW